MVAAVHPFYGAAVREFEAAGRAVVPSGPVGVEGTEAWLEAVGEAAGVARGAVDAAKGVLFPMRAALAANRVNARVTMSGYEGSELLVARLLVESGADLRYVGTACPRTPWSEPDRAWLEARGVQVAFRASLEQDLAAFEEFRPDVAIGTTPVVQHAKERGTPALYFTNLISARPLMGPAGAGSLAPVVNAAAANKGRFDAMRDFFAGVGEGPAAGVWERGASDDVPADRPEFREHYRRQLVKLARARKAEEMV